jgi:hypothetical protein
MLKTYFIMNFGNTVNLTVKEFQDDRCKDSITVCNPSNNMPTVTELQT